MYCTLVLITMGTKKCSGDREIWLTFFVNKAFNSFLEILALSWTTVFFAYWMYTYHSSEWNKSFQPIFGFRAPFHLSFSLPLQSKE